MSKFEFPFFAYEAEERWNLIQSAHGSLYGALAGRPVHLFEGADNGGNAILGVAVGVSSISEAEATRERWLEEIPFLKKGMISVEEGAVFASVPSRVAGGIDSEELTGRIEQMAALSPLAGPQKPHARPAIVNGTPAFLTEIDVAEIEQGGRLIADEYEQSSTRWLPALIFGLIGVVVSALAWAVIAVVTDREFWLVAIGAGLLIGYLVTIGARKTNLGIQIMVGILTVGAVLLGQLLTFAWLLNQEFVGVSTADVFEIYGSFLADDTGSMLFAVGGGLIGGWYGAKLAGKPQLTPEIEIAPASPTD